MKDTVKGVVREVIYSNEETGYAVLRVKDGGRNYTVVGCIPYINVGETIEAQGQWVEHKDFGKQFKVTTFTKSLPASVTSMERYLATGGIKGIGPVMASKIIEKFGDQSLHIIENEPDKLTQIRGISSQKAIDISNSFKEQGAIRDLVVFFASMGLSSNYAYKAQKKFGESCLEKIKEDPYLLCEDNFGLSFANSDKMALDLGIIPDSPIRIMAGIKHILTKASADGHTFLYDEILKDTVSDLLAADIGEIDTALSELVFSDSIKLENEESGRGKFRIYKKGLFVSEDGTARRIMELYNNAPAIDENIDANIKKSQQMSGIQLSAKQEEAVKTAVSSGVSIITGGPGTGKTTIIKTIVNYFGIIKTKVLLAAPTGRAAKRMTEATGTEAKTVHRLLEMSYTDETEEYIFARNDTNPLEAQAVIIDEVSMMDIVLMYHLLKAVPSGRRLILVGDADQLPSVGPGNVLKDLIESEIIPCESLTEIYRQAEESMIVVNAHRVNNGKKPFLNEKNKDFYFLPARTPEEVCEIVIDLCDRRLPIKYGYDPLRDIQVICPMRKGTVGVNALNKELQAALNPKDKYKLEKASSGAVYRNGDKVMQTKNNYMLKWKIQGLEKSNDENDDCGVFNGDVGFITKVDNETAELTILFDDKKEAAYDYAILNELEHAFAITIHKSQGSEFPVVILPIHSGPSVLLTRNLLYTAITRAKKLLVVVGREDTLYSMVENEREALRLSTLKKRMINYHEAFKEFSK